MTSRTHLTPKTRIEENTSARRTHQPPYPQIPAHSQVGRVCKDQVVDYAKRKSMEQKEVEKWLGPYLAYDDSA
ncbi:hypothetical protein T492DRAFT_974327 [Pavlovales sp. CCMP2436]|nr:hypothetical protein T492DRAFT_974327 [Pavlovales sp. CCMP2436]|eukprot:CAMPEP_0179952978 /NCGR_PEP_ID=MMETSP0983-20121128/24617_1 /TAXON_ID=483367 /ORGANISM="non described non described, Strain CCMP 2436" /LENGTH=72 /DNA_ID=CAMNT_0021863741 /DNA_START=238 /DNA_END=456 /DNA_ORIENTATION=+